jgi:hypothetical protein
MYRNTGYVVQRAERARPGRNFPPCPQPLWFYTEVLREGLLGIRHVRLSFRVPLGFFFKDAAWLREPEAHPLRPDVALVNEPSEGSSSCAGGELRCLSP